MAMVPRCSLSPNGCPCLALYMQPGRVYMSCGLRNCPQLLGLRWAARWASKYVFGWAASSTPMVGCLEGMPTSVSDVISKLIDVFIGGIWRRYVRLILRLLCFYVDVLGHLGLGLNFLISTLQVIV